MVFIIYTSRNNNNNNNDNKLLHKSVENQCYSYYLFQSFECPLLDNRFAGWLQGLSVALYSAKLLNEQSKCVSVLPIERPVQKLHT